MAFTFHNLPPEEPKMSVSQLNSDFCQLEILGRGGFSDVILAKKRSGRNVALKMFTWKDGGRENGQFSRSSNEDSDSDDGDQRSEREIKLASFERELDAVLRFEDDDKSSNPRLFSTAGNKGSKKSLNSIIFCEDWFEAPSFACIVMKYADGGTLAQEIARKTAVTTNFEPYTERRIGWYLLQICDALRFAHNRGVAHMDVKSANVLIDKSTSGHKLILTDWGSSCILDIPHIRPSSWRLTMAGTFTSIESITELYASPELQNAYEQLNFQGLAPVAIDAFAVGCILYELLCCNKMYDLTEQGNETLGEYIGKSNSVEHALGSSCLRLAFDSGNEPSQGPRYSKNLKDILTRLLDPNPATRFSPTRLFEPLRSSSFSPLMAPIVSASQRPMPGVPVTVDNVQLGMFVGRGRDWSDGESDGGLGSVGVVTRLDPDGNYTEVSFPPRGFFRGVTPMLCRIGANNKYELQIAQTPMENFVDAGSIGSAINYGMIHHDNCSSFHPGVILNNGKCMIMAVHPEEKCIIVAPMEQNAVSPKDFPPSSKIFQEPLTHQDLSQAPRVSSGGAIRLPSTWQRESTPDANTTVRLVDVTGVERSMIVEAFFSVNRGMDIQEYEICQIQRVQSIDLWANYARHRELVMDQNWGLSNEQNLFFGTLHDDPVQQLSNPSVSLASFFKKKLYGPADRLPGSEPGVIFSSSRLSDGWAFQARDDPNNLRRLVLARVELGRISDRRCGTQNDREGQVMHSFVKDGHLRSRSSFTITVMNPCQAYPEYIVTYKKLWNGPPMRVPRTPSSFFGSQPASPRPQTGSGIPDSPTASVRARLSNGPFGSTRAREPPSGRRPGSPRPQSSSFVFGSSTVSAPAGSSTGIFGSTTATPSQQSSSSLFGGGLGAGTSTSTGWSGRMAARSQQSSSSLFGSGSGANTSPSTSLFGSTTAAAPGQQSSTSLFGSGSGAGTPPSTGLFGRSPAPAATPPAASTPAPAPSSASTKKAIPKPPAPKVKPVAANNKPTASTGTTGSPSKVKECVICMEREVTHILIPCGHPCLCEICSTTQGLHRLKSKCPECRNKFREAIRFYGKVVEE
jgi:serine/threonine protein kinase